MTLCCVKKSVLAKLRFYRDDVRGSLSVELVFVLPLLLWAYIAIVVFNDAYRARMEGQAAALNVADMISRNTDEVTVDYLEGMNDVFDFLTTRNRDTRLRISSMMWDADSDQPEVVWSYGTRGLPSLLDLATASVAAPEGDGSDPEPSGDSAFDLLENQLSVANLADRIPPVLPGEALILVETFSYWESPLTSLMGLNILNNQRLTPLAVTRPRFSPFIRFELDNEIFPEGPPEILPTVGELDEPAEPEPEEEPEPETTTVTIVNTDFNDADTTGWSQDKVQNTQSSSFLGPFGQETRQTPVTYQVNLGGPSTSARIEFDLLIIDSWDGYDPTWARPEGEFLMIQVNGTSIALDAFQVYPSGAMAADRRTVASRAEGRFTTNMTLLDANAVTFGGGWDNQLWRVVIDVENPTQTFTLGFSANLNEAIDNESFGFTNFRITAERGNHGPAHFVPNVASRLGEDPLTRFTSYSGCPDMRIPAANMTLNNSDVWEPLRMQRRAGGTSWLGSCGISGASRYIQSSASMVLNYTNDTNNLDGNRLRIRTEDGNRGRTCDATLLIRDPFGQWSFNSEIRATGTNTDYNARINLGHAETGEYHIWMGHFSEASCATDLRFERY
ncbi:TadE/TadG family type IV pilus assembly protein [Roseinatronobacter monicus]|uniref:Flp pilus assembly protein TadG n=1 Tax=Roseinatronobacter monicus TaxID=393481 RepID=A0A543KA80_9RHOB|nr:hypothetical protein [Roseinatronobacter monicus]TQM91957.1 hypothetical protein BD293_0536 [Roseinatronobacter monicus]